MGRYDLHDFKEYLKWLEMELSDKQIEQFIRYYELLISYNEKVNLTSITNFDDVIIKHFIDSLTIIKAVDINDIHTVIDVGTGAGFPGIPVKIAFPDLDVTLLDSLNKRIDFINIVIDNLGLDHIVAVHDRAENYIKCENVRESFDLCVSRAVSKLSVLSEYCIPYIKVGGNFVSYKSEKADEELENATNAINILGCMVKEKVKLYLPKTDIYRSLIVLNKVKNTPEKYPRKAGLPIKKPL